MNFITGVLIASLELLLDMAPFLVLGFLFAGLMNEFISAKMIARHLGANSFGSVIKAALFGIPLPLCSCGVIPPTRELQKAGASRGSVVSFLVATPTSGVDSIAATYSLMGPVFTVYRVIASFFSGIFSGLTVNAFEKNRPQDREDIEEPPPRPAMPIGRRVGRVLHYGFIELLSEIGKWLVIGILIGGLITYLIPENFFSETLTPGWQTIVMMIIISVPIYVCATGSIPVAAALMMKGLNPGAAFVFLLVGPATNSVTITVISKFLGKRTTLIYLITLILSGVGFGLLLDALWGSFGFGMSFHEHVHEEMLPMWLQWTSTVAIVSLLVFNPIWGFVKRKKEENKRESLDMDSTLIVPGMTCNNCVAHVQKAVKDVSGVDDVNVDLKTKRVDIQHGEGVAKDKIIQAIENAGYDVER